LRSRISKTRQDRAAGAARRSARVLLNLEAGDGPKESAPAAQGDYHLPVGKGEFVNGLSRGEEVEAADEFAQPLDVGAFDELGDPEPRIEAAHGSPEDTRRASRWREPLARPLQPRFSACLYRAQGWIALMLRAAGPFARTRRILPSRQEGRDTVKQVLRYGRN